MKSELRNALAFLVHFIENWRIFNQMRTKICRYCGEKFSDIDFPAQFDRMITCGSTECMKQRRWEREGIVLKEDEIE